jgi:hypothetical protein
MGTCSTISQRRIRTDWIYREEPGLFIFETCEQFRRTVPVLPRDKNKLEDLDTNAEDHAADDTSYRLRKRKTTISRRKI